MALPIGSKIGYGAGQVGEGVKTAAFTYFLFFYYTQVLGLAPARAGLALFIATTIDALVDPPIGSWSDRLRHRWGRRHPFMYASALPLALGYALIFAPPHGLGDTGLFVWLLTFAVFTRVALSLFQVPYMALGAELSPDYAERTSIVGWRTIFGAIGQTAILSIAWTRFFHATPEFANGQMNAAAYPGFGMFGAAIIGVFTLLAALSTHRRIPALGAAAVASGERGLAAVWRDGRTALASRSFRALFLSLLIFQTLRGTQEVLSLHQLTFFWRLAPDQILRLTLLAFLALLLGVPAWTLASRRLDKKPTLVIGIALFCGVGALWPLLKLLGWYPEDGTAAYLNLLLVSGALSGLAGAAVFVAAGSMVADAADDEELATGRRLEGVFFGAILFATQATSGLGGWIGGLALQVIGFDPRIAVAAIAPDVIRALGAVAPVTQALALLSLLPLASYQITRASHARIVAALATRRELDDNLRARS